MKTGERGIARQLSPPINAAVIWECYGPYHRARVAALRLAWKGAAVFGVQVSDRNATYAWADDQAKVAAEPVVTLFPRMIPEAISARAVFSAFRAFLRREAITVAFLPSYWPAASAALLMAARSCGVRVVMMNESHAGTELARGVKRSVKKCLVRLFHAGLVGGQPQIRHFRALGLPRSRLFAGYDAVDNDYFARKSGEVRAEATSVRKAYSLPDRYILSLGRMVRKKNLSVLLEAYAKLAENWERITQREPGSDAAGAMPGLVFVGSGEEEELLRQRAAELQLAIFDRMNAPAVFSEATSTPGVYFYGFRQIEETPVFYALADVFVLPSEKEEWGLVVNEAMASGLPVVVSRNAGCAEDLVEESVNGFTFDPASSGDLAAKLTEFLRQRENIATMGLCSREIVGRFGCDTFARQAILAAEAAVLCS